ncbi:MAG: transcriptional regulator, XRE family protein, partial [Sphaerospermopsis sp. SIO1G2]|nr:transcriptional regulator, XRE family protein [Sphaerospermopsis sp. SIO1G2]
MGKRSFRASVLGVDRLNQTFYRYGQTQEFLASVVKCTRQTVKKFLAGKPIRKDLFTSLCNELELDWQDIAERESEVNRDFRTVSSVNKASVISTSKIEGNQVTLVEAAKEVQTCITFDTIRGKVVITTPGDINSFLQNHEQQNIWL